MSLIERLEAAEAGSREFDCEVWCIFDGWAGVDKPPCVTTSIDAALALAERVLPDCCPGISKNVHQKNWYAWIGDKHEEGPLDLGNGRSLSPALALCIAILKAKETK